MTRGNLGNALKFSIAAALLAACGDPGGGGSYGWPPLDVPGDLSDDASKGDLPEPDGSDPDAGADAESGDTTTGDEGPDASLPDTVVPDALPDTQPGDTGPDALPDTQPGDTGPDTLPDTQPGDTSSDTGPDTGPQPVTSTIAGLQLLAEEAGCNESGSVELAPAVVIPEAVVTSPAFEVSDTLVGYFLQDPAGGEWASILAVVTATADPGLAPGARVAATGKLQEFYCFTQLGFAQLTPLSTGTAPAPTPLAPSVAISEAWEGALVQVKNVEITSKVANGVYATSGGFLIEHGFDFLLSLEVGETYDLTGTMRYAFGQRRLHPRSLADITVSPPPAPHAIVTLQSSPDSVACANTEAAVDIGPVSFEAITVTPRMTLSGTYLGQYVVAPGAGPYGGVFVVTTTSLALPEVPAGHLVSVAGVHHEYYCFTEVLASSVTDLGPAPTAAPPPPELSPFELTQDLEAWEGLEVTVRNLQVTDVTKLATSGTFSTDYGLDVESAYLSPKLSGFVVGDYVDVTAFVRYSFGTYRLAPTSASKVVYSAF